jgi:hypothetical protein
MSRFPEAAPGAIIISVVLAALPVTAEEARPFESAVFDTSAFDVSEIGREATDEEIAGWDIDIYYDGENAPEGRGTALEGEDIYVQLCASCHGDFGEGAGRWPELAGGEGTLASEHPVKTVGSYWPYAGTLVDYIYRAMPYGFGQSLPPDELYAVSAYILYLNDVIDETFELSHETLGTSRPTPASPSPPSPPSPPAPTRSNPSARPSSTSPSAANWWSRTPATSRRRSC